MPSTTPCFSMNSVQLLITWGTREDIITHEHTLHVCVCVCVRVCVCECVCTPSWPELSRCSHRSHPNTRSLKMPLSLCLCVCVCVCVCVCTWLSGRLRAVRWCVCV